jgi:hypothetical protein
VGEPIIDLCPVCGRVHVTSTEGAACAVCDPPAPGEPRLLVRRPCTPCDGDGTVADDRNDLLDVCGECDGHGVTYRTPTPADLVAHVARMRDTEAVALVVALVRALPDKGPKPWQDGDARCHCTHCRWCGRLHRTEDYGAHRSTCVLGLVVEGVRRG